MAKSMKFLQTAYTSVGVLALSIIITQCTAISTPLPARDVASPMNITSTASATQIEHVTGNPVESEITTITPPAPALSPTPDAPILEPGGPGAAANLQSVVDCDGPGESVARLSWTLARNPGQAQRVDITIFKKGFETGQFESSELLPPDQSSLEWEELDPGLNHRWRVLTLQSGGWVPSEIAIFKGPVCVGDEEESTPVIQ